MRGGPFIFDMDMGFGKGGGWKWSWQGSRKHGRRQWFDSGDMKYVILKVLRERPMHGYEVMKALEGKTNGCYKPSPGTVYPTLQWLDDEGLVRSSDVDGKKVYAITEAGIAFLEENKDTVDDIFGRIGDTINRFVGEPALEINRALGHVAAQTYRAAWKLSADDARHKRIVEILEKAARDIEGVTA